MYSNLVERCFNSCCNDFTSKALSSKEVRFPSLSPLLPRNARRRQFRELTISPQEQCVLNCTDKFLKHSERVGARFAEQNAGAFAGALVRTWLADSHRLRSRTQMPWVPAANKHSGEVHFISCPTLRSILRHTPNSLGSSACPAVLASAVLGQYKCCTTLRRS